MIKLMLSVKLKSHLVGAAYISFAFITQTKAPSLGRVKCLVFKGTSPTQAVMDWLLNDAGAGLGSVCVSFCI